MPKETSAGSSVGGLVYLKYTYNYRSQFGEPNDEWLEDVDATSDELLGLIRRQRTKPWILHSALAGRED
jgi:hypothetical protein